MGYQIDYACVSSIGKCRSENQDNFICIDKYLESENQGTENVIHGCCRIKKRLLLGVFDGLGGECRGEMAAYIASRKASRYAWDSKDPSDDLRSFCLEVNSEICRYAAENNISSMGTTAAMLLFDKKAIYLCNIGDSKIFQYSSGKLEQISVDHIGMAVFGHKPPLTQNLGIPECEIKIDPYIANGEYHVGDMFLICSDGLTDMVSNEEICETLKSGNPSNIAAELLGLALERGGIDNTTIIVIRILNDVNRIKRLLLK